jgi:creatinine amidohydrolase
VIHYGDLTWPEVAALPRDLPLVLPLGSGCDLTRAAGALGIGELCLLPALPYGWRGSPVAVEPELISRALQGILSAPGQEGFQRLVVLAPEALELELEGAEMLHAPPGTLSDDPPGALRLSPQRVVLVPVGHTEQHGLHLPMSTDTIIIEAIAQGTAAGAPERAETLPAFPYGASTHRGQFAGTFNMGGRTFEDFMLGVVGALASAGADRIYLMSGHGGNMSFLVNVVKFAGERFPAAFTATAYLHTSGRIGSEAIARHRRSKRGGMGHAGELETSMLLHLRPDLCRMDRVVDETDFITTPNYYMDWVEGGELIANPPWTDDTQTGAYGAGSLATAENGARWLEAAIQEKLAHVEEIHQQQDRRLARRAAGRSPGS